MIRHGSSPFLECSSKGDRRFSAFYARIKARGGQSIEDLYQGAKVFADGKTGLSWRDAKGKAAENMAEVQRLYAVLWDEYIAENPELLAVLTACSGVSDVFGQPGRACQATELWRIREGALAMPQTHEGEEAAKPTRSIPAKSLRPGDWIAYRNSRMNERVVSIEGTRDGQIKVCSDFGSGGEQATSFYGSDERLSVVREAPVDPRPRAARTPSGMQP